jgi:hypothetical protein
MVEYGYHGVSPVHVAMQLIYSGWEERSYKSANPDVDRGSFFVDVHKSGKRQAYIVAADDGYRAEICTI